MIYTETVRSPWWTYATVWALSLIFCFTVAAISFPLAGVLLVLMIGVSTWLLEKRSLKLAVDEQSLHVGPTTVARTRISGVQPLDAEQLRDLAGQDADARATLVLRNLSTKSGVKVETSGEQSPYWLISTEHPQELADALTPAN